jgi:S-DNA-T family DNA segregation ATPase FtsK/SpoIIIE
VSTDLIQPDDRDDLPAEGGRVIPLRQRLEGGRTDEVTDGREISYEVALDDEPERIHPTLYADVTSREDTLLPIIPASLRGWANLRTTAGKAAGRQWHRLRFHAVRLPLYVPLAVFWALVGVWQAARRQLRWWWVPEVFALEQDAASRGGHDGARDYDRIHRTGGVTRRWRGIVLFAELIALVVTVAVLMSGAVPWWARWVALAAVVPMLAHVGRPDTRPIITPAVLTPRFRLLNMDIVARAYYAAKLGDPDKPGQQVTFPPPGMRKDGDGSQVLVDLPYGKGLSDAVAAREKIASGLDVAVSQVFITRDPSSHRRHVLWVADRDPLAIPAGRTPLLRCAPTDIWTPAPFGLDERGNPISVDLLWHSILIGAQPRQGKTFSARLLALYAALDPHVKLTVLDAGGKPDWRKFALVADRYAFGLAMTRDGDPVDIVTAALREIKTDVQDRYERLSALPVDVCPEGKLTRDIARDPRYRMPVRLVVLDEFQEYFDLGEASKEIASLLVYLVKVAPAAGVSLVDATQRPSGIGTGQISQQFISFRDNHQVRFSLRTGSWNVSDLVLGAGAYSEGYDSSTLLPEYKGVGILRGASDATPTVRTYLADAQDAEKILHAARALRERAGTLTGMAAGEDVARQLRDVLADARSVFRAGEAWVSWPQLAARLVEQIPEHYAGTTSEAISATLRGLKVDSVDGRDKSAGNRVVKGAKLASVDAALKRKAINDV